MLGKERSNCSEVRADDGLQDSGGWIFTQIHKVTSISEKEGEQQRLLQQVCSSLVGVQEFRAIFREVLSDYVTWQRKFPRTTTNCGDFHYHVRLLKVVGAIPFSSIEIILEPRTCLQKINLVVTPQDHMKNRGSLRVGQEQLLKIHFLSPLLHQPVSPQKHG